LLIDLLLENTEVLVVGGGDVGERKTLQLLDSGAHITVVSRDFTRKLQDMGHEKKVKLVQEDVVEGFIERLNFKPKVIIVALNNKILNRKISEEALKIGSLFSVVDDPSLSDFTMPAVAKVGEIRIGISTRGASPAMAGLIRRRVEMMIEKTDILQVELQKYARNLAKQYIHVSEERGKVIRSIIINKEVIELLRDEKIGEARKLVKRIILDHAQRLEK
jgi:precorrin-2 dehydrogenase/sirohydrochlorin ferrochelatase